MIYKSILEIAFQSRKIEKIFNSESALQRNYGEKMTKKITSRLAVLRAARNLALIPTTPPDRRHQLKGRRTGQFAVDLVHPYRLIFKPNHDPLIRTDDGGIDTMQVTAITIIGVIDYH